jgi:hypothetical protein
MQESQWSGLIVEPLASQVHTWLEAGKLDEGDLDRLLTPTARSIVESVMEAPSWVPLSDVEGLVALVAEQVGGGAGLVEWAEGAAELWATDSRVVSILDQARGLIDATGYVIAQSSERVVQNVDWRFEGGRDRFNVRLRGFARASADLKTLLGALLARLGERTRGGFEDLRFEGVDSAELCIFGERRLQERLDGSDESRLHRAALIA